MCGCNLVHHVQVLSICYTRTADAGNEFGERGFAALGAEMRYNRSLTKLFAGKLLLEQFTTRGRKDASAHIVMSTPNNN